MKRVIRYALTCILCTAILVGCGVEKKEKVYIESIVPDVKSSVELPKAEINEVVSESVKKSEPKPVSKEPDSIGAKYSAAIDEVFRDAAPRCMYKLIYINDDDVPELYFSGDCEATGSGILYINTSDMVETVWLSRIAGAYDPGNNLYYHEQGHMGYYFDEFYGFVDGVLVSLESGYYTEVYDENAINEDGEPGDFVPDEVMYNNEAVTYDEYCNRVAAMLEGHDMVDLQEWEFTKDGLPIESEEYWDHWGEEGYEGGPRYLSSYDEIKSELLEF